MLGRNSAVNQTGTPSSVSDRSPHLSSIPCPLSQLLRLRADVSRKPTSQPSKKWREEKKRGLSSLGYDAALLQPLKFGFHCFATGTFIDFRRRTVMDAAFIVIVERLPPSLSFSLPPFVLRFSFPQTKKFHPSTVEIWFLSSEIIIEISNLSKIFMWFNMNPRSFSVKFYIIIRNIRNVEWILIQGIVIFWI